MSEPCRAQHELIETGIADCMQHCTKRIFETHLRLDVSSLGRDLNSPLAGKCDTPAVVGSGGELAAFRSSRVPDNANTTELESYLLEHGTSQRPVIKNLRRY